MSSAFDCFYVYPTVNERETPGNTEDLSDLEPMLLHSINDTLHMDAAMARRNSPIHLKPTLKGPYISAVGGAESDEFIRQSREFAQAWTEVGAEVEFIEPEGRDHFSIVGDLVNDDYVLWQRLKTMLKL